MVAPVLFLVLFGLFEVAIGYMAHHLIQDAARQGCRSAISNGQTNATVSAKVNTLLSTAHVSGATTTILVNDVGGDVAAAKSGDYITVQVTVPASKVSLFGRLKGSFTALCRLRR